MVQHLETGHHGGERLHAATPLRSDGSSLPFLTQVSEVLAGSLDYDETHEHVLDLVVPAFADLCSIHLLDDTGRFVRIASRHHTLATAAVSAMLGESYLDNGELDGLIHQLVRDRRSLLWIAGDIDLVGQIVGPSVLARIRDQLDLTSAMVVPLIARGRPLGVLTLSTAAPRRPATSETLRLVEDVARQAALALDNARLYRAATAARLESEGAQRRLSFLAEASATLSASLDVQATLQAAVSLAVPTLADCCGVATIDDDDGSFRRMAVAHVDPEMQRRMAEHGPFLPIDEYPDHPIRQALASGRPVLVKDIRQAAWAEYADDAYRSLLEALAFHSVLVVPLEARGRRLGALTLALSSPDRAFGDDDIALGTELAGRAALAIEHATLYRQAADARDDLRRQLDFSDAIVSNIAEGITVVDHQGNITYANPIAESMLGLPLSQMLGRIGHDVMHVRDLSGRSMPRSECGLQAVYAGGVTVRLDNEAFIRADGTTFPVSVISSPLVRDGEVVGAITVFRDVSEARAQQEALRRSEERLQRALRSAGMVMWERSFTTGRTVRSELAPRLYGRSSDELLEDSLNHLRLIHPDDRECVSNAVRHAILNGVPYDVEYRVTWPDGTVRWLCGRASLFRDANGSPLGMSGTTHDITDRKRAELERQQLIAEREAEADHLRALHQALKQSLDALLGLHEVGKLLISVSDTDAMAQRLLEIAVRAASLRAAVLRRVEGTPTVVWRSVGDEAAIAALDAAWDGAADDTPDGRATPWQPTWTPHAEIHPQDGPALTVWRVPLIVRGEVIGVLEGAGDLPLPDEPTAAILGSIGLQAATAVENARLYGELAARERSLQQLVQALLVAQEDERRRLAYEIHDGFAQLVWGLQQLLEAFLNDQPSHPADARHRIEVASALAQRAVQEIRQVLAGLRPAVLDDFGLASGLRSYLDGLRDEGFDVTYVETFGPRRLSSELEITLFRLAQEALGNVRKHAGVHTARLHLTVVNEQVVMEVEDAGQGFNGVTETPSARPGGRFGLLNMQERIAHVGGELKISTQQGQGTRVRAVVPIQEPARQSSQSSPGGHSDG
ncbi:MAG: GAF domain-containing protein [Chloroflexi bacterium]|nr:GAF domain-containing protein [Chloroflexota bacterium]